MRIDFRDPDIPFSPTPPRQLESLVFCCCFFKEQGVFLEFLCG